MNKCSYDNINISHIPNKVNRGEPDFLKKCITKMIADLRRRRMTQVIYLYKATPHNSRRTPCLHIIPSDCAIRTPELCGIAITNFAFCIPLKNCCFIMKPHGRSMSG